MKMPLGGYLASKNDECWGTYCHQNCGLPLAVSLLEAEAIRVVILGRSVSYRSGAERVREVR